MPDFSTRSEQTEWMDDPAFPVDQLRESLRELTQVNRWLRGYKPSLDGIRELLPEGVRNWSLLDVGTGGGDTPCQMANWAARQQQSCEITAIDCNPHTIAHAQQQSSTMAQMKESQQQVNYRVADIFDDSGEHYDIVHGALVMHHFKAADAVRLLTTMYKRSRYGIIINDLHRHMLAYYLFRLSTYLCGASEMLRHDGAISVMRGFQREDLVALVREAGLPQPRIRWYWAFRWQVIIAKPFDSKNSIGQ